MRNLHLLIFLIVLSATKPANAQRVEGVLKFGVTQTTFAGNLAVDETTWKNIIGIAGGSAIGINLVGGLSLVGELLYLQMGAKVQVQQDDLPNILTSRSSYLAVPVLAQYRFESSRIIQPRIFMGGSVLFQLESVIIGESGVVGQVFVEEDDSIEPIDYGLIAGAGVDFYLASQRFMLEIRYYHGQSDVTKPNIETGISTELNNRGWAIMTGVLF